MGSSRPNRALIAAREAKGYSQRSLAAHAREKGLELGLAVVPELDAVCKQVYRLERGTTARPGEDFYVPALCAALGRSASELFGEAVAVPASARTAGWRVVSRKYVPVVVGAEAAALLATDAQLVERVCDWLPVRVGILDGGGEGRCTVSVFGFGVVVVELVEEQTFSSIAELAVWRRTSYRRALTRVPELLSVRWPALVDTEAAYVLSTFQLVDQHWQGEDLHTAMRLLSAPAVLLERRDGEPGAEALAQAEVAERACLRDGFTRPDIDTFGIEGVSIGYASWSGVSYLPLSPSRAVDPEDLATFETVVQALWCYTHLISAAVQAGQDPVVPDGYGWRFLRACLSHLISARPQETGQDRMMRDAILSTSRLVAQLTDAHAVLRDVPPLPGRR